jgi:hypothetical protein
MKTISQSMGNFAMLLYVTMTAISCIFIHQTNQLISPTLSAFYTFLFCIFVYGSLSIHLVEKYSLIKQYWFEMIMLNLTTAICWIFTFYSLKMISPELYLFHYLCFMTIASSILYKRSWIKTCLLLVGLFSLTMTYRSSQLLLGVILASLGGISGTVYSVYSKKITHAFSTGEILALRFYATVILTFFITLHFSYFSKLPPLFYFQFALISLISVIIPLTLFQIGLKNLHLNQALSWLPIAPLLCYFILIFSHSMKIEPLQLLSMLFLCTSMFFK